MRRLLAAIAHVLAAPAVAGAQSPAPIGIRASVVTTEAGGAVLLRRDRTDLFGTILKTTRCAPIIPTARTVAFTSAASASARTIG